MCPIPAAAIIANSSGWTSAPFILFMEAMETMAYLSVAVNLFEYLFKVMHFPITSSANGATNFMGAAYLISLVGGFISDTWLSRFSTLLIAVTIQLLGYFVMTLSTALSSLKPLPCTSLVAHSCHEQGLKKAVFFLGLYLVATGTGILKPNLPALGADQFNERDPEDEIMISTFFNWFWFSFCMGALIGVTVLVYVQDNVSHSLGFGIAFVAMLAGLVTISLGSCHYKSKERVGSPLTRIAQVVVSAFRNRKVQNLASERELYEIQDAHQSRYRAYKMHHTHNLRFFDNAAIITDASTSRLDGNQPASPWRLCTVTEVEEVKAMVHILPIFASTIIMNSALSQIQTFYVGQGNTMDRRIGSHFEIPPASFLSFPLIVQIGFLPVYDLLIIPLARRLTGQTQGITHLQRIGTGLALSMLSMIVAALVEMKRVDVATDHSLLDDPKARIPLKIYWLAPQYFILGIADMFTFVGLMEFLYSHSPPSMRSMSTSLSFVSIALGNFFSSGLVSVVNKTTSNGKSGGWLQNNLNRSKLSYFYWLQALLNFLNLLSYLFWAWHYKSPKFEEILPLERDQEENSHSSHPATNVPESKKLTRVPTINQIDLTTAPAENPRFWLRSRILQKYKKFLSRRSWREQVQISRL
ncbi:hypothetical protein O6H91_Y003300 [Diphasiastrum complanatum]|nr:hypothetical protein O6H91_Y003300 [Diphasiastrum complanatum]